MKSVVFKYDVIFVVVATFAGCAKVTPTLTPSTPVTSDTPVVVKVDTTVKTKPTPPDSTVLWPKALYIKVLDASGIQPLPNVAVAISGCIIDTIGNIISTGTCSLAGTWHTDASGTIFIDSSVNLMKPGGGLQFAVTKENYWADSTGYLIVQPGFNKADTITFTLYAVSWLRVHLQDLISADSGQLEMYFDPNAASFPPTLPPPSSNSNIIVTTDPGFLVGYVDHLKFFAPGINTTFLIKTTATTTNQIFVERYIDYYDKPGLYNGTRVANNFDTLDWEIKLQ
jgi:hypothetical protein